MQVEHASYNYRNPLQEKSVQDYNKIDLRDITNFIKKMLNKKVKPKDTWTTKMINLLCSR